MASLATRRTAVIVLLLAALVPAPAAAADPLCGLLGYCRYESPGFHVVVVDAPTERPLADVHALAEWVLYGPHGREGALMAQEATSSRDGLLAFPAWGPRRGPRTGIVLNSDPAVSFFKPGYRTLVLTNVYPPGTTPTTRVRPFGRDGATIALEPFTGTVEAWVKELKKAAYPPTSGGLGEEELREFGGAYLARLRRVAAELRKVRTTNRDTLVFIAAFERDLRAFEATQR